MTYLDFIDKVRNEVSYYVKALMDVYEGKCTADEAVPELKLAAQYIAKSIKDFEANRENDSRDIHLCPVCNRIIHKEGEKDEAEFPCRVGQRMEFQKDIWQSYEGYTCPLCRYDGTHKIEHWE